ncbi:restriction endonuclease [Bacillus salitolerans]|uniref:Restriction endonuclease n=1 Tax=Bacillus salitolerans TaxID=1437434 RepID=A0ABW4LM14_9BACI
MRITKKLYTESHNLSLDLVITDPKDGLRIAVQCKNYSSESVGNGPLLKLEAGKRFYKCPATLFITTTSYTSKAIEYATQTRMEIWNGLMVEEKIVKWMKKASVSYPFFT